jgi:hypothetical protein
VQVADSTAGQNSTFSVMAGNFNNGKLSGDFFASRQSSETSPTTVASGAFASTAAASSGIPNAGTVKSLSAQFDTDGGGNIAGAPQSYSFSQDFAHIATPAGLDKVRTDATLMGFAGGIIDTIDHGAGTVTHTAVQSAAFPGGFIVDTSVASGFVFAYTAVSGVAGGGSFDGLYFFGFDATNKNRDFFRGVYIDPDHFAALAAEPMKGLTPTVNGQGVASSKGALASAGMADLSRLDNYKACRCEYTKWGFWAVDDVRKGGKIEDRGHLMEWVAGQIPDLLGKDIPTTGTASYGGHVVTSIRNGGAAYVAAGRFQSTVDFGASTGRVSVSGLDGVDYRGHIALDPTERATFGSVKDLVGRDAATSAVTKLRMTVNGAFYGSKVDPAKEMGGHVAIRGLTPGGQNYLGSGIFAARR